MPQDCAEQNTRVVITVLGKDRAGIVARVTTILASTNTNILDISQTILQGIFTMTMLVDTCGSCASLAEIQERMAQLESELDIQIKVQKEDVFTFMHRL